MAPWAERVARVLDHWWRAGVVPMLGGIRNADLAQLLRGGPWTTPGPGSAQRSNVLAIGSH